MADATGTPTHRQRPDPTAVLRHFFLLLILATSAHAHEMRPATLEITEVTPEIYDIVWQVPGHLPPIALEFVDDAEILKERLSGRSGNGHIDRWRIRRPGGLPGTPVMIDGLYSTSTDVVIRVSLLGKKPQSALVKPDNPVFVVGYEPGEREGARIGFQLGLEHVLRGAGHLVLLLGLVLLADGRATLVKILAAFMIASCATFVLSTLSGLHLPAPLLNAAIALSILFVGLEILRRRGGRTSHTLRSPWTAAFALGLLHGFGFANGLSSPGAMAFLLGLLVSQLAFVLLVRLITHAIHTLEFDKPRWATWIPGGAIAGLGALWTLQAFLPAGERF